jgi:predicted  nucleic acid-binding Zn-ribbon protein
MIGRWRASPPTKILHKYVVDLEKRLEDIEKNIRNELGEIAAVKSQLKWLKKRIDKENDPKERSNIELSKEPS